MPQHAGPVPLSLLACQVSIPSTRSASERNAHVVALCAKIQQVIDASGAVDLVVLPELCTIEYGTDAFAHLDVLAEPANGSSSQAFAQLACNTAAMVVFGLAQFRRHPGDGKPSLPTEPEPGRGRLRWFGVLPAVAG
ncbi:MAG: hypothetical protein QGF79_03715 [Arenicellales bacterium]|nr:hypothetical protein [Arenicellales bacterium]